eukprot:Rhum_TRINITY_DN15422_c8_g1::Rhum_TRINITY_DN15422_c8_g1_i1::g.156805::m.156805/K06268/PPP3R, CNB; serine/threonine-protein phosphatase 2B regulatory subunit
MPAISPEDSSVIAELAKETTFSADEIRHMQDNFKKIAASRKDDGLIDREEFTELMGSARGNQAFIEGLFRMFDADGDGFIDFREFVMSLSVYQNKNRTITEDEKLKMLFNFYDVDGDGEISSADLFTVLKSCLDTNFLALEDSAIQNLVDSTLARHSVTSKGGIDFREYTTAFKHRSAVQ